MSDQLSDEVKIKLRHGDWEVEISCAESRVKQVVENVLSSLDSKVADSTVQVQIEAMRREIDSLKARPSLEAYSARTDVEKAKGGMTCRGLMDSLWQEGYFSSERALAEVHEELGRKGYNYDRTAVSHALADMVR